jgi:hypothetical protein
MVWWLFATMPERADTMETADLHRSRLHSTRRLCARFLAGGLLGKDPEKRIAQRRRGRRENGFGQCGIEGSRGSEPSHRHTSCQSKVYRYSDPSQLPTQPGTEPSHKISI